MRKIHQIGLIANEAKPGWKDNLHQATSLIERASRIAVAPQLTQRSLSGKQPASDPEFDNLVHQVEQTDLILVFGGDGTMLHAARTLGGSQTPILGINAGHLGFLTAAPMANLPEVLDRIWKNEFEIDSRPFLEASRTKGVGKKSRVTERWIALNDFVISRREVSRMIQLQVSVDDQPLTTYRCDGLIVSSPTGSTAYSLSAGGPIISPQTEAIALTPICPHALSNRSVIVPLKSRVQVDIGPHLPETVLTGDGQFPIALQANDVIDFRRSQQNLHLLTVAGDEFFQTLREKMKWSGSNV